MYRVYRKRSKKMERNVQLKCRSMLVVPQKSARRATGEHLLQEQGALAKQILLQSFRIIELAWACSSAGRAPALQAGGRRFDPGHVHQFFLSAKDLAKTFCPDRSIIRAHRARMRHWTTSVHNGAVEKHRPPPPASFPWLGGSTSPRLRASFSASFANTF